MTWQVSGASGVESSPKFPLSTLNQGDRLPQCLNKSNAGDSLPEELCLDEKVGARRLGAPVWSGYAGAVATRAGSAPVGVGPAWPTSEGKKEGKALVGFEGGN